MIEVWRSLGEYLAQITKAWWQLAIGVIAAGVAVATHFDSALVVPGWLAAVVAVIALFVAQFRAYHELRLAHDQAGSPMKTLRSLHGITNELSGGRYWPNQLAGRLQSDEDALTVRIALSPRSPRPDAQLDTELRDAVRRSLDQSPLERWFQQRTGAASPWAIHSPSTHYLATLTRNPLPDARGPAVLAGYCQFQTLTGPQSPRVVLLLDVVVRTQPNTQASQRFRFSRLEIYKLCHILITTAMDIVAPGIFATISEPPRRFTFRQQPPPVGPSIYLVANHQTTLADFIDLSDLRRAPGAAPANINSIAAIETPFDHRLTSFSSRDQLIRSGLQTMLSASEFLNPEATIDALTLPSGAAEKVRQRSRPTFTRRTKKPRA